MKQQSKPVAYMIATSLLTTSGIFFYFGLEAIREIKDLQENGIVTTAKVSEHFTERRKSGNSSYTTTCLRLTFTTAAQKTVSESICQNSPDFWKRYPIEKQLEILHSPNNPSNLVLGTTAPQENIGSYVFLLFSAVELIAALFFLRHGLKTKPLQKKGTLQTLIKS